MKIKITITQWSGWNGGSSTTKENILPINFFKRSYRFIKHKELFFGFKIKKFNKDSVKIKVYGDAGKKRDPETRKYKNYPPFILELNSKKEFRTHTFDWGIHYIIELIK
jgi:hypothetical protein